MIVELERFTEAWLARGSSYPGNKVSLNAKLLACCNHVKSGHRESFSHAARVLACMHLLAVKLPEHTELTSATSRVVAEALVMSGVLPAAVAMVARLAPRHSAGSDLKTCACCHPDAPTWSRMVVMTSAGGIQRRLSVSQGLALLIDQLLTVAVDLMAWVEQGVKSEAAEGQGGAGGGRGAESSQDECCSWRQLSDCLHDALKAPHGACTHTCHSMAVLMQASFDGALHASYAVRTFQSPSPPIAPRSLKVEGSGVELWPSVTRCSLLLSSLFWGRPTQDSDLGALHFVVDDMASCTELCRALATTLPKQLAGCGPQGGRAADMAAAAEKLWMVACMLRTAGVSAGMSAQLASILKAYARCPSGPETLSTVNAVANQFVRAVCNVIPAALSAASRDEGVAGAAHALVAEAVQALWTSSPSNYSGNEHTRAVMQPAVCIAMEQVAVNGLGGQATQGAVSTRGDGKNNVKRGQGQDLGGPHSPLGVPQGNDPLVSGRPSTSTCALLLLSNALWDATTRTPAPTSLRDQVCRILEPTTGHVEATALGMTRDGDAGTNEQVAIGWGVAASPTPVEATAVLAAGWTVLLTALKLCAAVPEVTLRLGTACGRLHRAVVGAYTGAAPGRVRDTWRVAIMRHRIAHLAAVAVTMCSSAQPTGLVGDPRQARLLTLTLVPWSLPVMATALVQQTSQWNALAMTGGKYQQAVRLQACLQVGLNVVHQSYYQVGRATMCEAGVLPGRALSSLVHAAHQHPSVNDCASPVPPADASLSARATCSAALSALKTGCVEGLEGAAMELLWALQLAEWLPRLGPAFMVTDAITIRNGLEVDSSSVVDSTLLLLLGVPLLLPHVLESWAVLCEGGAAVSTETYVGHTLGEHLRTQLLPALFPALGLGGHTGWESGSESGSESAGAPADRVPGAGCGSGSPGQTRGAGEGAAAPSGCGSGSCGGGMDGSSGGGGSGGDSAGRAAATVQATPCAAPCAPRVEEACNLLGEAVTKAEGCRSASDAADAAHACMRVLRDEVRVLGGRGSSRGRDDPGVPLLSRVAHSWLVCGLHLWCGAQCADAVRRMGLACRW